MVKQRFGLTNTRHQIYELRVKGPHMNNPNKAIVMKSLSQGHSLEVTLKLDLATKEIVVIYEGKRAGYIHDKSPGYEEAFKVLAYVKEMTASTFSLSGGNYNVRMEVK